MVAGLPPGGPGFPPGMMPGAMMGRPPFPPGAMPGGMAGPMMGFPPFPPGFMPGGMRGPLMGGPPFPPGDMPGGLRGPPPFHPDEMMRSPSGRHDSHREDMRGFVNESHFGRPGPYGHPGSMTGPLHGGFHHLGGRGQIGRAHV